MPNLSLEIADLAATVRLAEDIAVILRPGDVIALSGDLGAGKSTLARAIIRAVAEDAELEVPSPTFTLVQTYALRLPVAHFDLYRIAEPDELTELGFEEAAASGAVLLEWPERAWELLPPGTIRLTITEGEAAEARRIDVEAPPSAMARLERSLAARRFLNAAGYAAASRRFLLGDASTRAYEKLVDGSTLPPILMNAPAQPDGPVIRDGKPYSQIAHLAENVRPFVAIALWLRTHGFSAPEILASDLDEGFLVVENLGSESFLSLSGAPVEQRYRAAAELLADLHRVPPPRALPIGGGETHLLPDYDPEAMLIEVDLLIDWYLVHARGHGPSEPERVRYTALWREAISSVRGGETHIVLRDYHSPNLIWRSDEEGVRRLGIIDFQDAMAGPTAYDLASLVQDARVTIPRDMAGRLVDAYVDRRRTGGEFDEAAFRWTLALMEAQRASKILGIFVRLKQRDGKPGYLRHLPRMLDYLAAALEHESLAALKAWYVDAGVLPADPARQIAAAGHGG